MKNSLLRGFSRLLFPASCAFCGEVLNDDQNDFCDPCRTQLSADPHYTCPRCSSTVGPETDVTEGCLNCAKFTYQFRGTIRLGPYEGMLRDAILRMKYSPGETLADCLGRLWASHQESRIRPWGIDTVIPVPLHWFRRLRRGYNQSAELSRRWAERLGATHRPGWVVRGRSTAFQSAMTATTRLTNLKDAFRLTRRACFAQKTVLIVDDVLTTGSTINEIAKLVMGQGAVACYAAVLAHN